MPTLHPPRFWRSIKRALHVSLPLAVLSIAGVAAAQTGTYGDLLDFNNTTNGSAPNGAMVCDSAGNKYQSLFSSIVKWTPAGVMSVVHSFTGTITYSTGATGSDGFEPTPISIDGSGNLFGIAQGGGAHSQGFVFEITTGGLYIDLHDFGGTITNANGSSGPDGKTPTGTVAIDHSGNLYGVAESGGPNTIIVASGSGMLWKITSGGVYKDLHDFGGNLGSNYDGSGPFGGVNIDASGNIFGTTSQGGATATGLPFGYGYGTVWELTSASAYQDIHDFGKTVTNANGSTGLDGEGPQCKPVFDSSGDMFGTTFGGGPNSGGVIWEITAGHVYKDLHDFGAASVAYSNGGIGKDGNAPTFGVVLDASGNMFVVTSSGGPNFNGTLGSYGATIDEGGVVAVLSSSGSYQVLHAFGGQTTNANGTTGWDGQVPNPVTLDSAGNVWGSTLAGGPNGVPVTTLPVPHGYGMMWEIYYTSLSAVSVSPTSVVGGASPTGTVTLTGAASTSGSLVTLSSNSSFATVPSSITVPSGHSSATFAISTFGVTTATTATISASLANVLRSATLTINPAATLTIALNPASVVGGATSVATVTLSSPAGVSGAVVTLSSNSAYASVPASVFVYAGALSQSFTVNTSVVSSTTTATLTAKLGAATASAVLTITPTSVSVLSVTPTSVFGLTSATGTVNLSGPAPLGGKIVYLSSNNSCAVVPSYVFIPTGGTSGPFTITTSIVSFDTPVTISANLNGIQTTTLTVKAAALSGLTLANGGQVFGPGSTTATLTLNGPAGAAGALVNLSSNAAAVSVPSSVYLGPGATSATVTVTVGTPNTYPANATITATQGLQSYTGSLTISQPVLTGLTVAPSSVTGGQTAIGTVSIPAMPGVTTIYLSSNSPYATVPASITSGDGVTAAQFTIQTTATTSAVTATIKASQGTKSYSANLVVAPSALSGISLSPTSVVGGQISTATVTLSKAAPTYGAVVNLSSSNTSAATVPSSVFVAAGATTATFTVSTKTVYSATAVTISGVYNGLTSTATLTVNPVNVATLTLSPTSVKGGVSSTGTVTLNAAAGPYGAVVYLSSNNSSASVPSYVFVAGGAISAKFTIATTAVAANTSAVISATTGSVNVNATLTVTH